MWIFFMHVADHNRTRIFDVYFLATFGKLFVKETSLCLDFLRCIMPGNLCNVLLNIADGHSRTREQVAMAGAES